MKKLASLLLAALMAAMLAACGGGGSSSTPATSQGGSQAGTSSVPAATGEPVTITYWMHSGAAFDTVMDELVADFNAANPDIIVETEYIPFADYMSKLIPALGTGTGPDVFKIQQGMVAKLAEVGSIQPLDAEVLPGSMIEANFVESTVGGMMYDGQYYGVPIDNQSILLYWNKDMLEAAGLDAENGPQSWDEFYEWARLLTVSENGVLTQSGWGTNGYWPEVQSYLEQFDGEFYDEAANRFVFADDPVLMDALEDMANMYRVDKVYNIDLTGTWAGFRIGLVGMMLGHPGMIGNLAETAPDLNLGVGLIPANNGDHTSVVTSWAFVASADAEMAASTRFIQYLSTEEVQRRCCEATGQLPSLKSLLDDPVLQENPHYVVALQSMEQSTVGRLQTGSMNTIWTQYWERVQTTDEDLQTIMKECQEALNAELTADVAA